MTSRVAIPFEQYPLEGRSFQENPAPIKRFGPLGLMSGDGGRIIVATMGGG
jgi:hypothetical protein